MTARDVEDTGGRAAGTRAPVQIAALVVSGVFLVVGVLGFVLGVSTHYDQLTFAGHHSGEALWGLFTVSVSIGVVHLGFGVAGVWLARTVTTARTYLMGGGLVCLVLFVYGVVLGQDRAVNVVPVYDGDNWLHLGLAVSMLLLGAILGGPAPRRSPRATSATSATSPLSQSLGR